MRKGSPYYLVRYVAHPNGKCHWYIEAYLNGERIRKWYRTRETAQAEADERNVELRKFGSESLLLMGDKRIEATECFKLLTPWGKTLSDATYFYIDYLKRTVNSISVAELCDRALHEFERKQANNEVSDRHVDSVRTACKKLKLQFGTTLISAIQPHDLRNWIAGIVASPATKNWLRLYCSAIFGYAKESGLLKTNPVADTKSFNDRTDKEPPIFTVPQLMALLNAAEPQILPSIVIGAFAGLRHIELERLDWREVHMSERLIEVKAAKAKTAQRRLIPMADNLYLWLSPYAKPNGPVWPPSPEGRGNRNGNPGGRIYFDRAVAKACLNPYPKNGLRHSFCSYHLAMYEDSAKTAFQAGHTSAKTTYENYFQLVKKTEAAKYWQLTPETTKQIIITGLTKADLERNLGMTT